MVDPNWIEHRRGPDGERLGWLVPDGDDVVAVDLLGRPRTTPVDWHTAEETLNDLGLSYLADQYELLDDDIWQRVRIAEVSTTQVRFITDHGGAIGAPQIDYVRAFPIDDTLRRYSR